MARPLLVQCIGAERVPPLQFHRPGLRPIHFFAPGYLHYLGGESRMEGEGHVDWQVPQISICSNYRYTHSIDGRRISTSLTPTPTTLIPGPPASQSKRGRHTLRHVMDSWTQQLFLVQSSNRPCAASQLDRCTTRQDELRAAVFAV
jgi:hypothetical protein